MDSQTVIENDQVISDKVITFSGGLVVKYKELGTAREAGLVRVTIAAEVERRGLVDKLTAAKIKVRDVDGKGLFAEVVTGLEAEKNAAALIQAALKDYPFGCLEAEVVGEPRILKKTDASVTVGLDVRFRVDLDRYDAFATRLTKALGGIAKAKGDFTLKAPKNEELSGREIRVGNTAVTWSATTYGGDRHLLSVGNVCIQHMPRAFDSRGAVVKLAEVKDKDCVAVAVLTQLGKTLDRSEWAYFLVDRAVASPLLKCASLAARAKLTLLNENARAVATERSELFPFEPSLVRPICPPGKKGGIPGGVGLLIGVSEPFGPKRYDGYDSPLFLVAPVFMPYVSASIEFAPEFTVTYPLTLTPDELRTIAKARCEVLTD